MYGVYGLKESHENGIEVSQDAVQNLGTQKKTQLFQGLLIKNDQNHIIPRLSEGNSRCNPSCASIFFPNRTPPFNIINLT